MGQQPEVPDVKGSQHSPTIVSSRRVPRGILRVEVSPHNSRNILCKNIIKVRINSESVVGFYRLPPLSARGGLLVLNSDCSHFKTRGGGVKQGKKMWNSFFNNYSSASLGRTTGVVSSVNRIIRDLKVYIGFEVGF